MTIQVASDDDIFARPPRALARQMAKMVRRQCIACSGLYIVALDYDGPPLCEPCRTDISRTRQQVRQWLSGVLTQIDAALAQFEALKMAHSAFWGKIEDARLSGRTDGDAKARQAHPTYALLLDAEQAVNEHLAPLGIERARLERALEVL